MTDLEDAFEKTLSKFSIADLPRPDIFNGYYTMEFPDGSHRTFRLFTQQKGNFAGKRILAMLIGPDNTKDYENFAFLTATGFQIWKRFAGDKQADYAGRLWKIMNGEVIDRHDVMSEAKCLKCNRKLTDVESIKTGIGPTCRGA